MKSLIRNIFLLILISLGFSSCVYDSYPEEDGDGGNFDSNTVILQLDLKILNPSELTTPQERIKTARVIIIGEPTEDPDSSGDSDNPQDGDDPLDDDNTQGGAQPGGIVELNRLYEFPTVSATDFSYTLTWASNFSQKSIYVIANEESVDAGLTAKLNQYVETGDAGDLEEWLTGYSFAPKYDTSGNTIYLPYTYSKTDFIPLQGELTPVNCWLAPVATKFVFYFENKREDPVRINGISMAYANAKSFMMPHVSKDALYMEYGSEMLYWPDWLAAVSEASWDHSNYGDNEWFNQQYGWITAYSVPDISDATRYTFIAEGSADAFTLPAATKQTTEDGTETVPTSHTTKIFYLPESINYTNPDEPANPDPGEAVDAEEEEEPQEQVYYLTVNLEDQGEGEAPKFENVPIPNLKALFRNTFVVIRMVMGDGEIEIYAMIAPWNIKTANGWVSEGNAPGPNPFLIRKK